MTFMPRRLVGLLLTMGILAAACGGFAPQTFAVGECVDALVPDGEEVSDLPVVDCAGEHLGEVVGILTVADADEWPGQAAQDAQAEAGCIPAFGAYVGKPFEDSRLEMSYLHPTALSWATGDRQIVCIAFEPNDARRSGSVKGTAE